MSNFQPTPRTKTILDDTKFKLSAEPLDKGRGRPTLSLYVTGNNPRIDVYTNVPDDKDKGLIRAKIDYIILQTIIELIRQMAVRNPQGPDLMAIECKDYTWNNRQRSDQVEVLTRIIVGRDEENKVYIQLMSVDPSRPKIRFYFGRNLYHTLVASDGKPLSPAETSRLGALAWARNLDCIYPQVAMQMWKEPERKQDGNGGGYNRGGGGSNGGGNNRNNNGGGGNNRYNDSSSSFDSGFESSGDDDQLNF